MPPIVALESTVIAYGLPRPLNLKTALQMEAVVREEGADPKTIGVIGGRTVAGLSDDEIRRLAAAGDVGKVSTRDLPVAAAQGRDGATTVAATMWIAHRHRISVFATGGIGGVHRGSSPFDVSADLDALARIPMTVVCAGPKSVLDVHATREVLETRGVTVVGYGTDVLPTFYCAKSDLPVDIRCDSPDEVAAIVRARDAMDLPAAVLVTVPVPEHQALRPSEIEPAIAKAEREAEDRRVTAGALTPFLLRRIAELTNGKSLDANIALLEHNARVAARIARSLRDD